MTTKDVIKLLEMDEAMKMELLNTYDFMEPAQKLQVDDTVWSAFDTLYDEKIKIHVQLLELDIKNGKSKITGDLYAQAIKRTDEEFAQKLQESNKQVDLAAAKKAMEQIVKEIKAAKKTINPSQTEEKNGE